MDIDVSDPKEPDKELPQSQEEALTLLETFSLKPSFTISSGVGVHAYWALNARARNCNGNSYPANPCHGYC